jgi:hypothetical protein
VAPVNDKLFAVEIVTITAEIETFILGHCEHGRLVGDATEPTLTGYLVTVACSCGVTFGRWITSQEAAEDLAMLTLLN